MTIHTQKHFSSASRIQVGAAQTQRAPLPMDSARPTSFYPAGCEIYAQGERAQNLYQVEFGLSTCGGRGELVEPCGDPGPSTPSRTPQCRR